ncbi:MAG: FecR domain-containing protein [Chitinophaga rupis]
MSQHEFDLILQKYLDGKCTSEEEKIVLTWYDTFIADSEITLSAEEKTMLEQKIWADIEPVVLSIRGRRPAVIRLLSNGWFRGAAAACIVLAVLAGGYLYFNRPVVPAVEAFSHVSIPAGYSIAYNEADTNRQVMLSDGSQVELQPRTALYYPAGFTGTTRDVYLAGNAFFRIAHDSSRHFIVHTDEGLLAEVLGTSFYVLHDKATNKVEVSVVTGKVSVYEEKGSGAARSVVETRRIILTPNQKVSYKPLNNQFVTSLVEEPKPVEPTSGKGHEVSFVFEEAPLSEVLKVLETTYGITIQTENDQLDNCHFTGDLMKQGLYGKLDIICQSTQSSYEVKGTAIYIRGKGCN